jgi:hypothetical protein
MTPGELMRSRWAIGGTGGELAQWRRVSTDGTAGRCRRRGIRRAGAVSDLVVASNALEPRSLRTSFNPRPFT